jgi:putative transposase
VTKQYHKQYQTIDSSATKPAVPESVSVAMVEIAEDMHEGLLALAVGAGLQMMSTLMAADVAAVCGPRGRHDPERIATRHGSERGGHPRRAADAGRPAADARGRWFG